MGIVRKFPLGSGWLSMIRKKTPQSKIAKKTLSLSILQNILKIYEQIYLGVMSVKKK
jgi:hypothetical protein